MVLININKHWLVRPWLLLPPPNASSPGPLQVPRAAGRPQKVLGGLHQGGRPGTDLPALGAGTRLAGAAKALTMASGATAGLSTGARAQVFRRVGFAAIRLLLIPGIVEALVAGGVAHGIFGMPILLAFTLGFILKAVGPAIVIQLMFDLQRKGRGVDKGAQPPECMRVRAPAAAV